MISISILFGALTAQGAGGYPVTGTSVTSGDPSGHFQISGGYLSPSAAGDSANLNLGPYSLTLNNGDRYTVNIDATGWSVRTVTEWTTVATQAAATLNGKKILLRDGVSFAASISGLTGNPLRRMDFSANGLIIEADDYATGGRATFADQVVLDNKRITWRGIRFSPGSPATSVILQGNASFPATAHRFQFCDFVGATIDPNGNFTSGIGTGANQWNNGRGIWDTAGNGYNTVLEVTDCLFRYRQRAITLYVQGTLDFNRNLVDVYYDAAVNLVHPVAGFESGPATDISNCYDNIITRPCARTTYTGNPHPDSIILTGRNNATQNATINWERNFCFKGNGVGQLGGIFVRDYVKSGTDSGRGAAGKVVGNLLINCEVEGISIQNAVSLTVKGNTVVGSGVDGAQNQGIAIGIGADTNTSGTHVIQYNICEGVPTAGGSPTINNNTALPTSGKTVGYAAAFFGGTSWLPQTRAEALATFSMKVGGTADLAGTTDAGAIGFSNVIFVDAPGAGSGTTRIS